MIIEFKTITYDSVYDGPAETHAVLVDGKVWMEQYEGIEPEDVSFCRDLESPHSCERIIKAVISAMQDGDTIEIIHTEETEE